VPWNFLLILRDRKAVKTIRGDKQGASAESMRIATGLSPMCIAWPAGSAGRSGRQAPVKRCQARISRSLRRAKKLRLQKEIL
jgi:hypothetical protein